MNKRQVIFLWIIAIALGGAVATLKLTQKQTGQNITERASGETLFESFPAPDVASVEIKGAKETITLNKKDSGWVLTERDDYPVNSTFVNDFLRTLLELKVTRGLEAGPSLAPRFGMDESAILDQEHGLASTFKDASGKELAKITLGKNIESGAASSPIMGGGGSVGRYIRNHADESGFYAISEMFPSISAEASRWLVSDFLNPEKIQSIALTEKDKPDVAWKLTRKTEEAGFQLEDAAAEEVLNATEGGQLKNLFSYARFDDVVPAAKVAERSASKGKQIATIKTFEGFTYTVTLVPVKSDTPTSDDAPKNPLTPQGNSLLSFTVEAELPKERKKEDDESDEDAKTKDKAFADRLKSLTEKLAKEKALAGRTFEVSSSTVQALLKSRKQLTTKPPTSRPRPPGGGMPQFPGGVQQFPGGLIAPPPGQ